MYIFKSTQLYYVHVLTYYYVAIYEQDNVIYTLCWSENKYDILSMS